MEYSRIIEKLKEHLIKIYLTDTVEICRDNSKRIKISERKETLYEEGEGCHIPNQSWYDKEICLYPSDVEEEIDTPIYRIDLICVCHRKTERPNDNDYCLFSYKAYAVVNESDVLFVDEKINPIINLMNDKVYELYNITNGPDDELAITLQAFVHDGIEHSIEEPIIDKATGKHMAKDGILLYKIVTRRWGELCVFTYPDNKTHVFDYNGHYGCISPNEKNVFYTFEDHVIHKYTIKTSTIKEAINDSEIDDPFDCFMPDEYKNNKIDEIVEFTREQYDGNIELVDEEYYRNDDEIFYGIEFAPNLKKLDVPFVSELLTPLIIKTTWGKLLLVKRRDGDFEASEIFDDIILQKEPVTCDDYNEIARNGFKYSFTDFDDSEGDITIYPDGTQKVIR